MCLVTSPVFISLLLGALLSAAVLALAMLGFREGDRAGDMRLVDLFYRPDGVDATFRNAGAAPVLIGLSLRRRGVRLWLEGSGYVASGTRRIRPHLLASGQDLLVTLDAGETSTIAVPARDGLPARLELVAVVGQAGRLRVIHHRVRLSGNRRGTRVRSEARSLVRR